MQPRPAPAFGRRPAPARSRPAGPIADGLSPAAERLRSTLVGSPDRATAEFAEWKRKRSLGRAGAWLAAIALMSPGAICLFTDVPIALSVAIEAVGIGASWWLRRRRREHLSAIRAWEPGQD
jgi:hypothetical protein